MNRHFEYSSLADWPVDVRASTPVPIEMHSILRKGEETAAVRSLELAGAGNDALSHAMLDAQGWLGLAAEQYQISAKLEDYVLAPVIIMPSDLPNRNGVGFPFMQLSNWSVEQKRPAYETWKGAPTYADHDNKNPVRAKGVVLASVMRPIIAAQGKTNLHKVITLCGFDRTKDPLLVNDILTRTRTSYSMGATVADYECSVCGQFASENGGRCEHLSIQRKVMTPTPTKDRGDVLSYYLVHDPIGFEVSSVVTPAFHSATNPNYLRL